MGSSYKEGVGGGGGSEKKVLHVFRVGLKDESGKNTINLTELELSLIPATKINTIGVVELDIWTFSP